MKFRIRTFLIFLGVLGCVFSIVVSWHHEYESKIHEIERLRGGGAFIKFSGDSDSKYGHRLPRFYEFVFRPELLDIEELSLDGSQPYRSVLEKALPGLPTCQRLTLTQFDSNLVWLMPNYEQLEQLECDSPTLWSTGLIKLLDKTKPSSLAIVSDRPQEVIECLNDEHSIKFLSIIGSDNADRIQTETLAKIANLKSLESVTLFNILIDGDLSCLLDCDHLHCFAAYGCTKRSIESFAWSKRRFSINLALQKSPPNLEAIRNHTNSKSRQDTKNDAAIRLCQLKEIDLAKLNLPSSLNEIEFSGDTIRLIDLDLTAQDRSLSKISIKAESNFEIDQGARPIQLPDHYQRLVFSFDDADGQFCKMIAKADGLRQLEISSNSLQLRRSVVASTDGHLIEHRNSVPSAKFPMLDTVICRNTWPNSVWKHIGPSENIRILKIEKHHLADVDFKLLKQFPNLQRLEIVNCEMSKSCLNDLPILNRQYQIIFKFPESQTEKLRLILLLALKFRHHSFVIESGNWHGPVSLYAAKKTLDHWTFLNNGGSGPFPVADFDD